ncbi:CDP-glycerol glycerophosphotransferase family protein [Vibrio vulnificus]|uniref:CDP-glycerol glycerophosphotransferase family protein n=1 Tax=Vibrio vulnificus TaxID=672 RepID=UPI001CDD15EC|nr:CDP-glycerol glycerophosphotransferase family protein [Vibrio vulnificus]MCA3908112.1 CDP-glycerol glycerophosphotransferase family protein [Vibrio vulnificus]
MLTLVLGYIFNLLNKIVPKENEKIVISSFPDFDDMCRGVLECEEGRIVILLNDNHRTIPSWVKDNTITVRKNSIFGLYHILSSKKIYYTHGLFGFFKPLDESTQLVINIWHGMPIKNIGYLDGKKSVSNFHYTISQSPFFLKIIAKAFGVPFDRVLIQNLPRNNILLKKSSNEELRTLKYKYKKVHTWLPTYRKSCIGDIRTDGEKLPFFSFSDMNVNELNNIFKEKNELLIIKPHPMAEKDEGMNESYSNIKVIDESWLLEKDVTLYELLSETDALWTDYSSVFIDYLLVNRPILFVIPDFEIYKNSRGFTFDVSEKSLPGKLIKSDKELINFLKEDMLTIPDKNLRNLYLGL